MIAASFLSGPSFVATKECVCVCVCVCECVCVKHVMCRRMCGFASCVFCELQIDNYQQQLTAGSQGQRELRKGGERWMNGKA